MNHAAERYPRFGTTSDQDRDAGYRNCSIRLFGRPPEARAPNNAFAAILPSDKDCIRWTAQSALISWHFMPQTFSV